MHIKISHRTITENKTSGGQKSKATSSIFPIKMNANSVRMLFCRFDQINKCLHDQKDCLNKTVQQCFGYQKDHLIETALLSTYSSEPVLVEKY